MWPVKLIVWLVSVNHFRHLVDVTPVSKMPSTITALQKTLEDRYMRGFQRPVKNDGRFRAKHVLPGHNTGSKGGPESDAWSVMCIYWDIHVNQMPPKTARQKTAHLLLSLLRSNLSGYTVSIWTPLAQTKSTIFSRPWQLTIKSITVAGGGWPAILSTGPYNSQQE